MSEVNTRFFQIDNLRFEYPVDVRFECQRCGKCCRDTDNRIRRILLLKDDVKLISTTTGLRSFEFANRCEDSEPYIYEMKKKNGKCIFLKGNTCQIYKFRPLICRFYPFQLNNSEEGGFAFNHTEACSGLEKGEKIEREFFEELSAYFLKKMKQR